MPATATKPDTLTAVYLETVHAWDSYSILRCESDNEVNEEISVKAYDCEEDEFEANTPYTFYGKFEEYKPKPNKWNPKPETQLQFVARKWRKVRPYDKVGVIAWLVKCPGIKRGIATRLWSAYGADAIDQVKDDPEQIGRASCRER